MKRKLTLLPVMLLVLITVSCASNFVDQSYKTLSVSKQAYESTLSATGDLYKQGLVSEEVKNEAIKYGSVYMFTHNQAVSSLLAYQSSSIDENKQDVLQNMENVASSLSILLNFLKPYIISLED